MLVAGSAQAVDWNAVKGKDVAVFYPGQASWEWALTESDHSGAKKFREGKNCSDCHRGEEARIGNLIVSGKKLEPSPIPGKRGSFNVNVKTASDGQRLYIRMEWPGSPGSGGPKMDPNWEVKATVLIDDGTLVEAKRAGCWGACHDDAIGMASDKGNKLTKYLANSRTKITRQGGDESYKPQAALDELMAKDSYLEYWQAHLNKGAPPKATDGYILEKRHENASAAVTAEGGFQNGTWVVVLSRALTGAGPNHKDIVAGKEYHLGIAIHEDYAEHRFHDVSLGYSLVLGQGSADFVAASQ